MLFIYVAIAFVLVIVLFALVVSKRPAEFRVERSSVVGGPPEQVFAVINDLHQWGRWSPWEKLDPKMNKTYAGPQAGPGSSMEWSGNKKVGSGRNTILESTPNQRIVMRLEMFAPFPADNRVTFALMPSGLGTRVAWIMEGRKNFMTKAFCMIMSMDKMVGKDFEEGLRNLNNVVRSESLREEPV